MTVTNLHAVRTRAVGAYLRGNDPAAVLRLRAQVGRVTVTGKPGLRALNALARTHSLDDLDLDPEGYLDPTDADLRDGQLFPIDWIAEQRNLGLEVIRSEGAFARRNDPASLKSAFRGKLPNDVTRVVSVSEHWLQRRYLPTLLAAVRSSDNDIALVLAALFDPLDSTEKVDAIQLVLEAASAEERRVELLRTDTHAIPFAVHGGTAAAIGLASSSRHHAQPMNRTTRDGVERRQQSAAVWVRQLMGWQPGAKLDAVRPFGGAGLTDCPCTPCDGRDLFRFTREWPQVPKNVRADARAHDVANWVRLRDQVLGAPDPIEAWKAACRAADRFEADLAAEFKVSALKGPHSLRTWS